MKISRAGVDEDELICRAIVGKFDKEGEKGVSYAEIAKEAWELGRVPLATKASRWHLLVHEANMRQLLDHEPRAAEQVPLLLQMREDKTALVKAVDSGDTDLGGFACLFLLFSPDTAMLVYHVLLHLRASLSPGDFFHLLDDSISPNLQLAVKLVQVYARQGDRQLLRDFYYQDDRRTENACLEMEEAGAAFVCWSCHI